MLKRDKLEAMLRKITDKQFDAVWKDTYGYLPSGKRSDLVRDFVAEQYDRELDGCIALAESLLTHTRKPKPNRFRSGNRQKVNHPLTTPHQSH